MNEVRESGWSHGRGRLRGSAAGRPGTASLAGTVFAAAMAVLAAVPCRATAQETAGRRVVMDGELGRRLDAYVRSQVPFGFAGQVLLARNGRVLLDGAYGWADRAGRVPMTRETRVGIASASKQLTAAALLHLAASGAVSVDDTLGRFFPDAPADKAGITLRMILTHTSGIRGGMSDDFDEPTLDATVNRLLAAPLTSEPGARWRYSSDAYNLIASVIQRVSEMPYQEYVRRELFAPAGMERTGFWREAAAESGAAGPGASRPDVARSYVGWNDRGTPGEWPVDWRVFGAGDVLTTADDLYRWQLAVADGRVLDPATRDLYFTSQVDLPGGDGRYGFGLFFEHSDRGGRLIEHGGDTELGFNASFFRYPDAGVVVIIVSNGQDLDGISARHLLGSPIEKLLFGDEPADVAPARPLDAPALSALAGRYALDGGGTLDLISDGALLWAAGAGQPAVDLLMPGTPLGSEADPAMTRTRELLDRLRAGDMEGYRAALSPDGVEYLDSYVGEWRDLVATYGPVHRYEVVGCARDDQAIIAWVRLRFRSGTRTMTFRWLDHAQGRLSGTNTSAPPYPWAFPVGRSPDGGLVVWDPLRDRFVMRVRPDRDGSLLVVSEDGAAVARTGPVSRAGWRDGG